jgi:hypothetical protein
MPATLPVESDLVRVNLGNPRIVNQVEIEMPTASYAW